MKWYARQPTGDMLYLEKVSAPREKKGTLTEMFVLRGVIYMTKLVFCHNHSRSREHDVLPHKHDCHELVFYEETARGVTDIEGTEYEITPLGVSLIHRGAVHSERHFEETNVIFLGFESTLTLPDGVWNDMGELRPLFCDIVREVRNQEWGYEKIISLKIQEILTWLERKSCGESSRVRNLEFCKQYIEENYMQDVSVGELAGMCGYSSDRFRHLFAEKFGLYPQNYLVSVRLENARHLLKSTNYSCVEIAMMCGFSDSS